LIWLYDSFIVPVAKIVRLQILGKMIFP